MKKLKIMGVLCSIVLLPAVSAGAEGVKWYDAIAVEFGLTGVLQSTLGNDTDDSYDQTDYAYSADFALAGEIAEGHFLNLIFEAGEDEAAADNIPARATPNYDAAPSRDDVGVQATIAQAYYEGGFWEGKLTAAFGKMDVHAYTDNNEYANDETTQFLNGLFVRSVGVVFAEHENYYVPTVALTMRPVDLLSVKYTYSHDGGEDLFSSGHHDAEIAFHPIFNGLAGNYRIGHQRHEADFTDESTGEIKSNSGFYISIDQALHEYIGVFGRYAFQDRNLVENEVESAWSVGAQLGGGLWGRKTDTIGVAVGSLELNKDVVKENNEGETVVEAYYNFGVNDNFAITVDAQFFSNLEREEKRDVSVFSIRAQALFGR